MGSCTPGNIGEVTSPRRETRYLKEALAETQLSNCVRLEKHFLLSDLEKPVAAFVGDNNYQLTHKRLKHITLSDVHTGPERPSLLKRG